MRKALLLCSIVPMFLHASEWSGRSYEPWASGPSYSSPFSAVNLLWRISDPEWSVPSGLLTVALALAVIYAVSRLLHSNEEGSYDLTPALGEIGTRFQVTAPPSLAFIDNMYNVSSWRMWICLTTTALKSTGYVWAHTGNQKEETEAKQSLEKSGTVTIDAILGQFLSLPAIALSTLSGRGNGDPKTKAEREKRLRNLVLAWSPLKLDELVQTTIFGLAVVGVSLPKVTMSIGGRIITLFNATLDSDLLWGYRVARTLSSCAHIGYIAFTQGGDQALENVKTRFFGKAFDQIIGLQTLQTPAT